MTMVEFPSLNPGNKEGDISCNKKRQLRMKMLLTLFHDDTHSQVQGMVSCILQVQTMRGSWE